MFPLVHAMGVTIHKFQGQTVDNLQLQFQSAQRVSGIVYVGMSRPTTESGISLVSPIRREDITVDNDIHDEVQRLRARGFDLSLNFPHLSNASLKIVFHNVQSIRLHFGVIRSCVFYQRCHLLVFCETWLPTNIDTSGFQIDGYVASFYPYPDQGSYLAQRGGMCLYAAPSLTIYSSHSMAMNGVHLLFIQLQSYTMLAVHSRHSSYSSLISVLQTVLSTNPVDIVFGDFNIGIDSLETFSCLMRSLGFYRPSDGFTTTAFTEIDLVFTKCHIRLSTLETIFSFHKPLFIEIN